MLQDIIRKSRIKPNDRLEEGVDKDCLFDANSLGLRATIGSYPFDPDPKNAGAEPVRDRRDLDRGEI